MFGIEENVWVPMLAGIFGVLVSGVISYLLQRQSFQRQNTVNQELDFKSKKVTALSSFIKLLKISSRVALFDKHFKSCIEVSQIEDNEYMNQNPYSYVTPLAYLPQNIHFSDNELTLNEFSENEDLLAGIVQMEEGYNSTIGLLRRYDELIRKIREIRKAPEFFDGDIGEVHSNAEEYRAAQVPIVMANHLIIEIMDRSEILTKKSALLVESIRKNFIECGYLSEETKLTSVAEKPQ